MTYRGASPGSPGRCLSSLLPELRLYRGDLQYHLTTQLPFVKSVAQGEARAFISFLHLPISNPCKEDWVRSAAVQSACVFTGRGRLCSPRHRLWLHGTWRTGHHWRSCFYFKFSFSNIDFLIIYFHASVLVLLSRNRSAVPLGANAFQVLGGFFKKALDRD